MLSFEETKKVIFAAAAVTETEIVPVRETLGRVLAEDLSVSRDFPDTRLSAVDGYAIKCNSGQSFVNVGVVAAGRLPDFPLKPGECAAVMTGATVPEGTDCVVRVENCDEKDGTITVSTELKPGMLINEPAFEAAAGSHLVRRGMRIRHALYPALFYAGISEVAVYKRPKIGVLTTGDELREVDEGPAKGQVFNTNLYTIQSLLNSIGMEYTRQACIPDDETETRSALEEMAETCDFIVSSGGVSMGRYDYVKKIFNQPDFSLLIDGTPIKPGRPLMVAEWKDKLFFGIPGYPSAFLVNSLLYLIPTLKKASGFVAYENQLIEVQLASPMRSREGRLDLNRAVLKLDGGKWLAWDANSQKTSHFLNFAEVNGLVFLPDSVGNLESGATAQAIHFNMEL